MAIAVPRKRKTGRGPSSTSNAMSERDRLAEQVIAALRFLSDECRRVGIHDYAAIVGTAFDQCLQLYVAEQREKLAKKITDNSGPGGKKLN